MSEAEDFSREAFIAAITKLADDEAFRKSFLTHYHLWMHPPLIATGDFRRLDLAPGAITFVSDEQMDEIRGKAMAAFDASVAAVREIKEAP